MASGRTIRAGKAAVEIGGRDRLTGMLRRMERRLQSFGKRIRSVGLAGAAGGAALVAPFALASRAFAKTGDELDKMSKRTGISVESLSELGFAAEQSGADLKTLEKGTRTMQRSINDLGRGLSTQKDAFNDLGLEYQHLNGLSPEKQFELVSDRLSKIEDPSKRAALAMMIFGRAGTQLLPMMENGAAGMRSLRDEARSLGLTVSKDAAGRAALLIDTMNILFRTLKMGAFLIGDALAPTIITAAKYVTRVTVAVGKWIKENRGLIVIAAKVAVAVLAGGLALLALGAAVMAAGGAFAILATAAGAAMTIIGAMLSPIGLAVAGVVALGVAVVKWSGSGSTALGWLGKAFGTLGAFVSKVTGGIAEALKNGNIQAAGDILWKGLRVAWLNGSVRLKRIWEGLRVFLVTKIIHATAAIKSVFFRAMDAIGINWVELFATLGKWSTNFAASFKSIWDKMTGFVAKRIVDLQGLADESIDTDALKAEIDNQTDQNAQRFEDERRSRIYEIEERRAERSGETLEDALRRIENEASSAEDALRSGSAERLERAKADLESARDALDKALADAGQKRLTLDSDAFTEDYGGLLDDSVQEAASSKSLGTFSAVEAARLVGKSQNAEKEIAKNTNETAEAVQEVIRIIPNIFQAYGA